MHGTCWRWMTRPEVAVQGVAGASLACSRHLVLDKPFTSELVLPLPTGHSRQTAEPSEFALKRQLF